MKSGDLVRVIKDDPGLAFNAKTKMRDRKFFSKFGIILDVYRDINLKKVRSGWKSSQIQYMWCDVYFGTIGVYHVREDILVVENESW